MERKNILHQADVTTVYINNVLQVFIGSAAKQKISISRACVTEI